MTYAERINKKLPARMSFRIPPATLQRLDQRARLMGLTRSEAIRQALLAYVEREEALLRDLNNRG